MKFEIIGIAILCVFILLTSHTPAYASDNSDINVTVLVEPESYCAFYFSEGLSRFNKDGKYGFIDEYGEVVIPLVYDGADYFSDGLASVIKDGRIMYIDKTGTVMFVLAEEYYPLSAFHDGLLAVCNYKGKNQENVKCGYLDKNGKIALPFIYDGADAFNDGIANVSKDGKYGCIDKTGKTVVPFIYNNALIYYSEGLACVYSEDRKWGFVD